MTNQEQYDSAWDELEQYRKIGTVDECRQAVEKQRPKEPKSGGRYKRINGVWIR